MSRERWRFYVQCFVKLILHPLFEYPALITTLFQGKGSGISDMAFPQKSSKQFTIFFLSNKFLRYIFQQKKMSTKEFPEYLSFAPLYVV